MLITNRTLPMTESPLMNGHYQQDAADDSEDRRQHLRHVPHVLDSTPQLRSHSREPSDGVSVPDLDEYERGSRGASQY